MPYLIGCDIGTTNVKTTAFDAETGAILGTRSHGYEMSHPQAGWSEQDPEAIYQALLTCIRQVCQQDARHGALLGISFSSAMHGVLALDRNGKALTQLIIWADNRSAAIADRLRNSDTGREIYQRNGTPIHAMAPVCKLIWLRQEMPELFARAHKFVAIKEYVIYRLTGKFLVDYSIASATGLFNIHEKKWDIWTLGEIGLPIEKLSTAVSPYFQQPLEEGNELGVSAGVPLIMGASDGCLANLGSGSYASDSMTVTIGTSAATRVSASKPYLDPKMRTFCYILDEETYIVGGASNNGAVIFDWLKDTFFEGSSYETVFDQAIQTPAGADGLMFYPYLLGERAPLWSSSVRGGFTGLDIQHKKGHFVRAVMEGVLLNLYNVAEVLIRKNEVQKIYANGGFAHSNLWVQMLADVFGLPVSLNDTVETGTVGAVMMAMKSLGLVHHYSEMKLFTPVSVMFETNLEVHAVYRKAAIRYDREYVAFDSFS
ncbi:gluconokinase [Dyadobacter tibetensis]|uniref:gluconokinase n=1 Tax=Dyadobacter tibetensis TaxID=1211851 RepID=UPI0004713185|nr:gluconokinase [Dyadobacter tibetensis]